MRTFKRIISLSALGLVLTNAAQASEREAGSTSATPAKPASPSVSNGAGAPTDAKGTKPDSSVNNPKREKAKPEPPDRLDHDIAEIARKFAEEVRQARLDFLKQQQELKKELRGVIAAERDQIRAMLRENRPPAFGAQPGPRQDFQQQLAELKEKLHEHKEALEDAQREAKDQAKKRKDGN